MNYTECSSDGQNVRFGSVRSRVQVSPLRLLFMKKYLITSFLIILFFILYFFAIEKSPFIEYKLNNKTYKLLTAKNSVEWQKGLMFYKSKKELKGADGMIFIFPNKEIRSFWNENTYLDLDVYWLDDDRVVGKDYLPSILKTKEPYTINSKEEVDKVIEIIK
ncbi:MAG: hypothetical protein US40_C0007G0033 [Candidatus Roizmanbacteria bacterium GW2011_GWC2_37_13]|uniref:DUF192 domain-containing protein n=1 Tax=Candidatus Roizmanbacteria bacterium GW2011_GWC2_37_13 TaxID=1618486 RepID=A0A0G0IMV4_9BACT|nr:MAG: hypothetical protein US38_C0012G0036 [Candidatus Roizmanbacteria bacterium GW2011_GWC1_37_12]KKQ25534.1 MAG: hypothetical protein US40_C0007G0033 [Candidatus Roizmanbacteria bacterium GW2011_GWC2_37_13]